MVYRFDMQIFYFVGFGLFCLESLLSMWVIQVKFLTTACCSPFSLSLDSFTLFLNCKLCCFLQRVYRYFRGSGKEAEMKREAARGAARAAF